jgi:osmotically-inducible protein OsmY
MKKDAPTLIHAISSTRFVCVLCLVAAFQLSACAPLVLGGAALAGKAVIDRRTAGIQIEDEAIELRSASGLRSILSKNTNVRVHSYNRLVLITGEVSNESEKALAERFVKSQDNVKSVINDVSVGPVSSLTQRAKDTVINGQLRTLLIQAKDVHSSAVHIVVERGIVYLMGRLTNEEAKRVTDLVSTSQVSGVEKVIRVFELLSEEDLRRLSAPAQR